MINDTRLWSGVGLSSRWHFRPYYLGLAGVIGVTLVQALSVRRFSFRIDESQRANFVRLSLPEMWAALQVEPPYPLHYILLKGWYFAFGDSEFALRSLSLAVFILTLIIVGGIGSRLVDWRVGLSASALMAFSPEIGMSLAMSARPYALLGFFVACSLALSLDLVGVARVGQPCGQPLTMTKRWVRLTALTLMHVLGLLTHPIYILYLGALIIGATWVSFRNAVELGTSGVVSGIIYLVVNYPILSVSLTLPHSAWMRPPDWAALAGGFIRLWGILPGAVVLVAMVGAGLLYSSNARRCLRLPSIRLLATLSILPALAGFAFSQVRPIYLETRTPILWLSTCALLIAFWLVTVDRSRWLMVLVLAITASSSIVMFTRLWVWPDPRPTRENVASIAAKVTCGDVVIATALSYSEVSYYLRRHSVAQCLKLEAYPREVAQHEGWLHLPAMPDLADEAQQTASRLRQIPGIRVWLLYDLDRDEYLHPIRDAFDRELRFERELHLRGIAFDTVYVYATGEDQR